MSQCGKLPLPPDHRAELSNIVRNRFHKPRPQRLALQKALHAGYTAIDILDGAVLGEQDCLERVQDIFHRTPAGLKVLPKPKIDIRQIEWEKRREAAKSPPEQFKLVNMFPRATVKGVRRVPALVNANGFPFLRWKRPQPASVTRILRILIRQRQRRLDMLRQIDAVDIPIAEREDEWEKRVAQEYGLDFEHETYGQTLHEVSTQVHRQFWEMGKKRKEWIQKMDSIIMEEQRLKDMEDLYRMKANEESREVSWIGQILHSIIQWKRRML